MPRSKVAKDICARKHKNNPQSVAANRRASVQKKRKQQIIFEHIMWSRAGLTCEQCELQLDMSHQTVSARISELKAMNRLQIVGRRKTKSGSYAAVYKVKWR